MDRKQSKIKMDLMKLFDYSTGIDIELFEKTSSANSFIPSKNGIDLSGP